MSDLTIVEAADLATLEAVIDRAGLPLHPAEGDRPVVADPTHAELAGATARAPPPSPHRSA